MEGEESLLDVINGEDGFETMQDVDMVDVEEGEIVVEHDLDSSGVGDGDICKQEFLGKKSEHQQQNKKKKNKKKNKKRKGPVKDKPISVDWFVRDTCRRLKEKKSYMIYTAVGCLGIPALSDLVNEFKMFVVGAFFAASNSVSFADEIYLVEAIETCGGQETADGSRRRTGGGILWNIIKAKQPAVHRETMKKTKEFEKQFRYPNRMPKLVPKRDQGSSLEGLASSADEDVVNEICDMPVAEQTESKPQIERKPVHERIRVPVSYDDDLFRDVLLDASSQAQHSSA